MAIPAALGAGNACLQPRNSFRGASRRGQCLRGHKVARRIASIVGKQRIELAERNRAFDVCAENNQQLLEINRDVLDRYEHTGLLTRVSATEPFTRLTRTRMENLVDETRERVEQLRVKKRDADAAAAIATPPATAPQKSTAPQKATVTPP